MDMVLYSGSLEGESDDGFRSVKEKLSMGKVARLGRPVLHCQEHFQA